MDAWLPGYERTDTCGAGLNWTTGTPWKVGLHTTETGPAPSLLSHWCSNPGSGRPHFLGITPDRIVQMLPLTVGAYTAQNPDGGIDTNRAHLIQIEVCEYAANAPTWSAPGHPWCTAIGRWLADLNDALDGALDLTTELEFGSEWVGFPGGPQAYLAYRGVLGHQHIPEQPAKHWDPGPIDIGAILAAARGDQEDDDMGWNSWTSEDRTQMLREFEDYLSGSDKIKNVMASGALYGVSGMAKNAGKDYAKVGTNNGDLFNAIMALGSGGGQVDVAKLADALRANLAAEVVDELRDRLAS